MLMMLLRRMMHKEDWRSQEDMLPHNPEKSGVRYMNVEKNFTLMKARNFHFNSHTNIF